MLSRAGLGLRKQLSAILVLAGGKLLFFPPVAVIQCHHRRLLLSIIDLAPAALMLQ